MKNTIIILLISQICVIANAQKYVLLNDLKYIGEIAYFNQIEFTGNGIQKTSKGELIKSEQYYQGKKNGLSWSIDGFKNIYISDYIEGNLINFKMISAKKDTIVDYAFTKSDKITNAGIEIEIKGFHNGNISSDVLCKLDKLSLQTCLSLTDMDDSLSTIKLNNVQIESFLLSSPGFISKDSGNHYDREWEFEVDCVDKEVIESLCKYHLKWISFGDIKLKTKDGTQFRCGGREYLIN